MSVCDPVTGMHHLFRYLLPQHVFVDGPPDLTPMRDALNQHGRTTSPP